MIMISYVDKVTQFVYQNAFLPRQNSKTKRMISSKVKQRQFHLQYANDKHGESNSFMWNVCIIVTLMLLSSLLFHLGLENLLSWILCVKNHKGFLFYILEIFCVNYSFKFLLIKFDYILTFSFFGVEFNFIHPEKDEVVTKPSFIFGSLLTMLAKAIYLSLHRQCMFRTQLGCIFCCLSLCWLEFVTMSSF